MDMMKQLRGIALMLVSVTLIFGSCKDPYILDDQEPEWLGASIYDYLKEHRDADGNADFSYFVRIIDSCEYADVLKRTGSKTMFVCYDSSFEEYFRNNDDGISCFEDFTKTQLKQIMDFSMVNEANLIETLSYGLEYVPGQVMRRSTSLDPYDLLVKEDGSTFPDNSPYFDAYRNTGLFLLNDNTSPSMVHFLEAQMQENNITDEDFSILFNGTTRVANDAHIFNRKVIERDITCKNGYIHVLDSLLMPVGNMAQFIREDKGLSIFNRWMDRFSAPYADASLTAEYVNLHTNQGDHQFVVPDNGFQKSDSIFVRRYLSSLSSGGTANTYTPAHAGSKQVNSDELLIYDPNWNAYAKGENGDRADMAAMFVPNNQAMEAYFSDDPSAEGNFLKRSYGSWDNVPNDIVALFLNAHMQYSFLASLPSKFDGLKNESLDEMFIEKEDVERAKVTSNGAVYVTKKVYPPVELSSVMAPVLVREDTRIFNYPVNSDHGMGFDIYLKSMESVYNPGSVPPYTFIVPLDNAFENYIYPAAQGYDFPEMLCFEYDPSYQTVKATRYQYDETTGQRGAMISPKEEAELTTTTLGGINSIVRVYLNDMMDYHIIVGEVTPEQKYYQTKGKGFIYVDYDGTNYKMLGGGNMEQNKKWSASGDQFADDFASKSVESIKFRNGTTIFTDRVMQQPLTSVYGKMRNIPQFSSFFECMEKTDGFFIRESGSGNSKWNAVDRFLSLFTAYHYTVYAPNNAAMQKAYAAGLPSPAQIAATTNANTKKAMQEKLLSFIKYHIQDNSVFVQGEPLSNQRYETALRNPLTGRFYSIYVNQDGENITLTPAVARTNGLENVPGETAEGAQNNRPMVNVVKTNNNYNLMTRDQILVGASLKDVVGSASDWSARAVIHEIDNYLSVVKPPVVSLSFTANKPGSTLITANPLAVTDNGDGVVYNGSGDSKVITELGFCWALGKDPDNSDVNNNKVYNITKDLESIERTKGRVQFSSMNCLSEYFTDGVRNDKAVAANDSIVHVRGYAVSKWATDGTLMEEGKTPMVGYSNVHRFNWVTGLKVNDDE